MTTHHNPEPLAARVLLDAIPGLIGFIPERSLVLVAFNADGSINSTMRQDLAFDDAGAAREEFLGMVENLAAICQQYQTAAVVGVVVEDRYPPGSPEIARLVRQVSARFDECGGLSAAYATTEYAAGRAWRTILCGPPTPVLRKPPKTGVLADPTSSPTALDRAFRRGRPVLHKRSQMCEMLAPKPHCSDPRCCVDDLAPAVGLTSADRTELLRFAFTELAGSAEQSRTHTASKALTCSSLSTWYRAITDVHVRDALLALAVTDLRAPAEAMWRELTQVLRGKGRASAATLLAHLHYIAGEGAYAGVALDVALGADPQWSFAILLDRALRAGVRPTLLWEVLEESYRAARRLGVSLPEGTLPIAG